MLSSVEQAFVGREEIRAPLKTPAWEANCNPDHKKFSPLSNTTLLAIFQNFVYGDVVYAQTWEVLALKNCIEPP